MPVFLPAALPSSCSQKKPCTVTSFASAGRSFFCAIAASSLRNAARLGSLYGFGGATVSTVYGAGGATGGCACCCGGAPFCPCCCCCCCCCFCCAPGGGIWLGGRGNVCCASAGKLSNVAMMAVAKNAT